MHKASTLSSKLSPVSETQLVEQNQIFAPLCLSHLPKDQLSPQARLAQEIRLVPRVVTNSSKILNISVKTVHLYKSLLIFLLIQQGNQSQSHLSANLNTLSDQLLTRPWHYKAMHVNSSSGVRNVLVYTTGKCAICAHKIYTKMSKKTLQ